MEIHSESDNNTLILRVQGRVDGANAREFEEKLKAALRDQGNAVLADLAELTYISSAGLRAILLVAKDVWNRQGKFGLCSLQDPIREVFEIAGFDKIIQIHDSRQDAMSAFEG